MDNHLSILRERNFFQIELVRYAFGLNPVCRIISFRIRRQPIGGIRHLLVFDGDPGNTGLIFHEATAGEIQVLHGDFDSPFDLGRDNGDPGGVTSFDPGFTAVTTGSAFATSVERGARTLWFQ